MDLVTRFATDFKLTHLLPIGDRVVSAIDRHGEFMHISQAAPVNGLRCVNLSWDAGRHSASWVFNGRWVPTGNAPTPERVYTLEEIISSPVGE